MLFTAPKPLAKTVATFTTFAATSKGEGSVLFCFNASDTPINVLTVAVAIPKALPAAVCLPTKSCTWPINCIVSANCFFLKSFSFSSIFLLASENWAFNSILCSSVNNSSCNSNSFLAFIIALCSSKDNSSLILSNSNFSIFSCCCFKSFALSSSSNFSCSSCSLVLCASFKAVVSWPYKSASLISSL